MPIVIVSQKYFLQGEVKMKQEMVCTQCGHKGIPKKFTKGNIATEVVLWILFIVPGIFYSVWRLASKYKGCPECKAPNMIPASSLMAKKILAE